MTDYFLYQLTIENKLEEIQEYLKPKTVSLRFTKFSLGQNLLHICSLNSHAALIDFFLRYEKTLPGVTRNDIVNWVNSTCDEGFTPLHYAVSKGNLELVRMLTLAGADVNMKTNMGLSAMHLAAQADHPGLIAYLAELGLPLSGTDSKGGTPLHWAAYTGSYYAITVLLGLQVPKNKKDHEGNTALHLAILGSQPRIVRILLLKGSDKTIKDNLERDACELSKECTNQEIQEMLKPTGIKETLGCKPKLEPYEKSYSPMFIFLSVVIAVFILNVIFCIQCILYLDDRISGYAFVGASGVVLLCVLVLSNSNPGYIEHIKGVRLSVSNI